VNTGDFKLLEVGDTIWDATRGVELGVVCIHKVRDPGGIEDTEYSIDAKEVNSSQLYVYSMDECRQLMWIRAIGPERESKRKILQGLKVDRVYRMLTLRAAMHLIVSELAKDDHDLAKRWGLVHVRVTEAKYLHELDLLADELGQTLQWQCTKNAYLSFLVDDMYVYTTFAEEQFFADAGLAD
jgi:hypothetical protein